ncbi:MAG: hypothetical protein J1E62_07600 [Lachnospiraceae bacterium]|nr:hypothetical protein [Lachnospiraceae bacterium]
MLEWIKGIFQGIERSTAPRLLIPAVAFIGVGIYFLVTGGVDAIGLSKELPDVTTLSATEMSSGDYVKAEVTSCLGPYYAKTVTHRRGRTGRRRRTTVTYYYLVSVNPEKNEYMSVEVEEGKRSFFERLSKANMPATLHADSQANNVELKQTIQGAVKSLPGEAKDSLEQFKTRIPEKNSTISPWGIRYETLESAEFTVKFAGYTILAGAICLGVWLMLNFKFYVRRKR